MTIIEGEVTRRLLSYEKEKNEKFDVSSMGLVQPVDKSC